MAVDVECWVGGGGGGGLRNQSFLINLCNANMIGPLLPLPNIIMNPIYFSDEASSYYINSKGGFHSSGLDLVSARPGLDLSKSRSETWFQKKQIS